MTLFDVPVDPPAGWQRDHVERYVETEGADGHHWRGVPTLLLTTIGRRTGKARRTPLIYGRDGDRYLIVASKGGSDEAPEWYRNLVTDPRVRIQVGADRIDGTAHTASPDEKRRLWTVMTGIWPAYDDYQARTARDIPLVVIQATSG